MSDLTPDDIRVLAGVFAEGGLSRLRIRIGDAELVLSRDDPGNPAAANGPARREDVVGSAATSPNPRTPPAVGSRSPEAGIEDGLLAITASNLGAFYRAPAPGEPPFVELGQKIAEGDAVGLLEVMKLYTSVVSTVSGIVDRICVPDGQMVEAGEVLLLVKIDPAT
ncbi:MAG TPA: biotin/lipoyl-containing protein [Pseudonocardiaceae bacterium]|nr:biotin/lipoyl-containing protein [Pseudonocardiaceae bacterium]